MILSWVIYELLTYDLSTNLLRTCHEPVMSKLWTCIEKGSQWVVATWHVMLCISVKVERSPMNTFQGLIHGPSAPPPHWISPCISWQCPKNANFRLILGSSIASILKVISHHIFRLFFRPLKINCMVSVTSLVPFAIRFRKTHTN